MLPLDQAPVDIRRALVRERVRRRLQTGNDPLPEEVRADLEDVVVLGFVRDGLSVRSIAVKYEVSGKTVRDILVKNRIPTDLGAEQSSRSSK